MCWLAGKRPLLPSHGKRLATGRKPEEERALCMASPQMRGKDSTILTAHTILY